MTNFTRVDAKTAAEVLARVQLTAEARDLADPQATPAQYLDRLLAKDLTVDAVKFMAMALPKRRAVWWACLAAQSKIAEDTPEPVREALAAAEGWVYKSSEENRRLAQKQAETAGMDHPAAMAAMAAFWAAGSMAPPHVPEVPPPDHLTGVAVANAIQLAVILGDPLFAADQYRLYLQQGVDIANGGDGRLRPPGPPPG